MAENKIILIGGYPKGYDQPFSEKTISGKRLHKILKKYNLNPRIIDLWETKKEELEGLIDPHLRANIKQFIQNGWRVIALGRRVHACLEKYDIKTEYLPHPASRRKSDLKRLEDGLVHSEKNEESEK